MILTTIQLAILIILPLLFCYRRVNLRIPQIVLFIAIVYSTTSAASAHAIGITAAIVTLGASSLTLWWALRKHALYQ